MPTPRDRRPLTPAQQALATRYVPLARKLAAPVMRAWPSLRDELESAALWALVEAAEAYDPARGVGFATFARARIVGALKDVQRRTPPRGWTKDPAHAPRVEPLRHDSEQFGRVVGAEPDPPAGAGAEAVEAVEALLRTLPRRHAQACRQLYVHGKNQAAAARALGLAQSRVSTLHRESLAMLRERECRP